LNDTLLLPANKKCTNGDTPQMVNSGCRIWENTTSICFLQNHFCPWSITGMEQYSAQMNLAFGLSYQAFIGKVLLQNSPKK